jgi:hypothetical protein
MRKIGTGSNEHEVEILLSCKYVDTKNQLNEVLLA